jgi:hypothetical protein
MEVREHLTRYEHSISSRLFAGLVQLGRFGGFSLPSGPSIIPWARQSGVNATGVFGVSVVFHGL